MINEELEKKVSALEAEKDRWACRMMLLEDRYRFAQEVLDGKRDHLISLRKLSKVAQKEENRIRARKTAQEDLATMTKREPYYRMTLGDDRYEELVAEARKVITCQDSQK